MAQAIALSVAKQGARANVRVAAVAWLLAAVYYFCQYALRSAPSVMMPQLSDAFGLGAMGVASIVGVFLILTSRADSVRSRIASSAVAMLAAHAPRKKQ